MRPFLREASVLDEPPGDLPIPPAPDRIPIALLLELPGSGGTRPTELLGPFLGELMDDAWILRTGFLLS